MTEGSLYQKALGQAFYTLPVGVQIFHTLRGTHVLEGAVETTAPDGFVARLLAKALGSPMRSENGPLRFDLNAQANLETWVRCFPDKTMTSRLTLVEGEIVERLGLATLGFALHASAKKLEMKLRWLRFMGVPCPRCLLPVIVAEETGDAERICFLVKATVPGVGVVARYEGYLSLRELNPK